MSLFWMVILVPMPAYVVLQHTRWGRYLFAIGSNAEVARLTGVNVKAMIYFAYLVSATLASRIGQRHPGGTVGTAGHRPSVIGGTSLFGAVGSVEGPLLGSLILTTINHSANLLNVNTFWQQITGRLIIVRVHLEQLRRKKR